MQYNQSNIPLAYGNLSIKPISAMLTHDTDILTKMDPFIVFKTSNGQKVQSSICSHGGKTPQWKEQLELKVSSYDVITIEIWDHHSFGQDESVASGEFQVIKVVALGGNYQDYVPLFYRGKPAGVLTCSWVYKAADNQEEAAAMHKEYQKQQEVKPAEGDGVQYERHQHHPYRHNELFGDEFLTASAQTQTVFSFGHANFL